VDEQRRRLVDPLNDRSHGEQDDTMQQSEATTESVVVLRPIVPSRIGVDNGLPVGETKLQTNAGAPDGKTILRGAESTQVGGRVEGTRNEESLTAPILSETVAKPETKLNHRTSDDAKEDSPVSTKNENGSPVKGKLHGRKGKDDYMYKDDDEDGAGMPAKKAIDKPIENSDDGKNGIGDERKISRKENAGLLNEKRAPLFDDAKPIGNQHVFDDAKASLDKKRSQFEDDKEFEKVKDDDIEAGN